MKKVISFLPVIAGCIILVLWVIVSLIPNDAIKQGESSFAIKQNYSLLHSDGKNFSVDLYDSNKNSILAYTTNYDCYIIDNDSTNMLKVDCLDAYLVSEAVYKDALYYKFRLIFRLTESPFLATDALLRIDTLEDSLYYQIGAFSITLKEEKTLNVSIYGLSGIFNYINGYKTLVGILATIENKSSNSIAIDSIEVGWGIVTNLGLAKEVTGYISYQSDITDYIDGYNYNKIPSTNSSITLEAKESKHLLIPVYYENELLVTNTYLVIRSSNLVFCFDNFAYMKEYYELDELKNLIEYVRKDN